MAGINGEIVIKPELRPCRVDGEDALFHKWIIKEKVVLVFKSMIPYGTKETFVKKFDETGVIPNGCEFEKVSSNLAIVEFRDGSVEEVEPTDITFLDGDRIFEDNGACWLSVNGL